MWQYECCPESYAGLHFTATNESCHRLIEVLADMNVDRLRPAVRTLGLRPLNSKCASYVAWGNPGEFVCYSKLRLELVRPVGSLRQMNAGVERGGVARVTLSEAFVDEFADGVLEVARDWGRLLT